MELRAHPLLTGGVVVFLCVLILSLIWDWNWVRPLVEAGASRALERPVDMEHFDLKLLSRQPRVEIEGLRVGNSPDFEGTGDLLSVGTLGFRVDALAALKGRLVLPEISIDRLRGTLRDDQAGRRNWDFGGGEAAAADKGPASLPEIGRVIIRDGQLRFVDRKLKADLNAHVGTDAAGARLRVDARGAYSAQPFKLNFVGGTLMALRDTATPYPLELNAENGPTKIALKGSLRDPAALTGAKITLDLQGNDLSNLQPLIGIPLAPTPPYRLKGALDYADGRIRFHDFDGVVGQSDLSGVLEVLPGGERKRISGKLRSRRVVMADLGGFIGATPGKAETPNQTPEQLKRHAEEEASAKLLPDTPINLPQIRSVDFDIEYRGQKIEGENIPLDNIVVHLVIKNGKIGLTPLNFGVGEGKISSRVSLDARQNPVHATADIDFQKVDLKRIMKSTDVFEGAGTIGGRAAIDTRGNSLAAMLGQGNGEVKLFMAGGDISALLVDLAGLDFGRSILSALGLPQKASIRCMIGDYGMRDGVLQTRMLLIDTTQANIIGSGTIDLRNETIDYRISTDPKHFSVGAINTPINIKGPLKKPSVMPDLGAFATRVGPAAAVGALLMPLAALVPTIQLGLGEDNDCSKMVDQIKTQSKTPAALKKSLPKQK